MFVKIIVTYIGSIPAYDAPCIVLKSIWTTKISY